MTFRLLSPSKRCWAWDELPNFKHGLHDVPIVQLMASPQ